MDYTVHGILQARMLEWAAISFSKDLPDPGIEPRSPALLADSLLSEPPWKPKYSGQDNFCLQGTNKWVGFIVQMNNQQIILQI